MKSKEKNKSIKVIEINYQECTHKDICRYLNTEINSLELKERIEFNISQYGKKINYQDFYYKKMDSYLLDNFKDLLKEKIDNSKNAYHLSIIYYIFKLLEKNDEKH